MLRSYNQGHADARAGKTCDDRRAIEGFTAAYAQGYEHANRRQDYLMPTT